MDYGSHLLSPHHTAVMYSTQADTQGEAYERQFVLLNPSEVRFFEFYLLNVWKNPSQFLREKEFIKR